MTRMFKTVALLCTLLIMAAATGNAGDNAERTKQTVARIGTQSVTEDELDRAIGNRLMRIKTEEYNLRRAALDEVIAERLLASEAARLGISAEALAKREIESKVAPPAPSDLEAFYEGTKERFGGLSKEDAIQQIADGMLKQKIAQRRREYIESLRGTTTVKVLIEPPRTVVQAKGPSRGSESAPITIVEFSDFECNFCGRATSTLKRIETAYPDKVRIVFRDYPLPVHRGAPRAAEAAQCASEQGKFWEMHDRLFSKGGPLSDADLNNYASQLSLDMQQFGNCLQSGKHTKTWKSSQEEGMRLGVASTPTFFINGRMVTGAMPYETFARIIDEELDRGGLQVQSVASLTHR